MKLGKGFNAKNLLASLVDPIAGSAMFADDQFNNGALQQGLSDTEGKYLGWDKEHQARKRQREAASRLDGVALPEFQDFGDLSLDQYQALDDLVNFMPEQGDVFTAGDAATYQAEGYDPALALMEREGLSRLGDSEFAGISLDPATRDKQMEALGELSGLTTSGMTSGEQARLDLINSQAGQQAKGARDALNMEMQRRGISGSGLELMGKQMANQSAAESMRLQGLQASQMADQRQMQALAAMSDLAGDIRGQDYGIASDRARAQDAINAWNAANTQGVLGRNADRFNANQAFNAGMTNDAARFGASAQNAASQFNTGQQNAMSQFNAGQQQAGSFANAGMRNAGNQWRIGNMQNMQNANTDLRNEQNRWNQQGKLEANNALNQQRFGNEWTKAGGQYNAGMDSSKMLDAAGQRRRADTMNILDTGIKGGTMAAGYAMGGPAGAQAASIATPTISGGQAQGMDEEQRKKQQQYSYYA